MRCYPIDACKSLLLRIRGCPKPCWAHMHSATDDLRGWTGAQATCQDIFRFLHRHHASHVGNRCCGHWHSECAAVIIRVRYTGVKRHEPHTMSHRDEIFCAGCASWVHAEKDYRGWWKGILGLLHSFCFGLSPICGSHTFC